MINPAALKRDFPIFRKHPSLTYLDSAAMSLKPVSVIEAVKNYYEDYSANVFRGVYKMSEKATEEYEATREAVSRFIHAKTGREIIFVRNTSEAINLIAYAWGRVNIDSKSELITTVMEHHSNFVPWQQLASENGAVLKVIDIDESGNLMIDELENMINKNTKLLAITYVSNALGTINPLKEIIKRVKKQNPNLLVLVDGAQAVPHLGIDVQALGCDFFVFSGQKMLGPTGAGVLWGKEQILDEMPPFLFGGEMIKEVHLEGTVFADLPHKFEAGTPHIAGVIGLRKAVEYLEKVGMDQVRMHEKELLSHAFLRLKDLKEIAVWGPKEIEGRGGVVTFTIKGIHPHDIAQVLDENDICVRAGHHCAMPIHDRLKVEATVRASLYLYNTKEDIDKLVTGLERVVKLFG